MSPRKRIGVMIPSTNTTCEADFQLTVPVATSPSVVEALRFFGSKRLWRRASRC